MATIYVSTTATGNETGANWVDAYLTLQDALGAASAGDTILINAPKTSPLYVANATLDGTDDVEIDSAGAPSGEAWLTGMSGGFEFAIASGIGSAACATEPTFVSYGFAQDDVVGTATGCALVSGTYARRTAWLAESSTRLGRELAELAPMNVFLTKNTATPTTPGDNEYGWSAGTLYVKVPGATAAQLDANIRIQTEGVQGIIVTQSDRVLVHNLTFANYPDDTSGAQRTFGYAVRYESGDAGAIEDCISYNTGYHAFGMPGGTTGACVMRRLASVGMTASSISGSANPFIYYTDETGQTDSGRVGEDLVFIGVPLLSRDGDPLNSQQLGFSAECLYSHTDGVVTLGGITWTRCDSFDFTEDIEDAHAVTMTAQGRAFAAGNIPSIADPTDIDDYPILCVSCRATGRSALPGLNMAFDGCAIDRRGTGSTSAIPLNMATASGSYSLYLRKTVCTTGEFDSDQCWITNIDQGDTIVLDGSGISTNATGGAGGTAVDGLFRVFDDGTSGDADKGVVICKNHSYFVNAGSIESVFKASSVTAYNNGLSGVTSDGTTLFAGFAYPIGHNNPVSGGRDISWWQTNKAAGDKSVGLAAPSGLAATAGPQRSVKLTWGLEASTFSGRWHVERRSNTGAGFGVWETIATNVMDEADTLRVIRNPSVTANELHDAPGIGTHEYRVSRVIMRAGIGDVGTASSAVSVTVDDSRDALPAPLAATTVSGRIRSRLVVVVQAGVNLVDPDEGAFTLTQSEAQQRVDRVGYTNPFIGVADFEEALAAEGAWVWDQGRAPLACVLFNRWAGMTGVIEESGGLWRAEADIRTVGFKMVEGLPIADPFITSPIEVWRAADTGIRTVLDGFADVGRAKSAQLRQIGVYTPIVPFGTAETNAAIDSYAGFDLMTNGNVVLCLDSAALADLVDPYTDNDSQLKRMLERAFSLNMQVFGEPQCFIKTSVDPVLAAYPKLNGFTRNNLLITAENNRSTWYTPDQLPHLLQMVFITGATFDTPEIDGHAAGSLAAKLSWAVKRVEDYTNAIPAVVLSAADRAAIDAGGVEGQLWSTLTRITGASAFGLRSRTRSRAR